MPENRDFKGVDNQGPGVRVPGNPLGVNAAALGGVPVGAPQGVPAGLAGGVRLGDWVPVFRQRNNDFTPGGRGITLETCRRAEDWAEIEERPESLTEEFRGIDGETYCRRIFLVPWSSRYRFIEDFVGWSETRTTATGVVSLHRHTPDQHPLRPWLFAVDYRILRGAGTAVREPGVVAWDGNLQTVNKDLPGPDGNLIPTPRPLNIIAFADPSPDARGERRDGLAEVEILYRAVPWRVLTDEEMQAIPQGKRELERYVTRKTKYTIEALPLPAGVLKWTAGENAGKAVSEAASYKLSFSAEITWTWYAVDSPPESVAVSRAGRVNDATFDEALGMTAWEPGTLLLQAPQFSDWYRDVRGRWVRNSTFSALWRETGWNALRDAKGVINAVAFANGDPLYPSTDFNTLFRPRGKAVQG